MRPLPFSKWDPSGNLTLLFPGINQRDGALLASKAMEESFVGAEQAGFYDKGKKELQMAGGEFCVNATRSFGALLAMEEERCLGKQGVQEFSVKVSGWQTPIRIEAEGSFPCWKVKAELILPECPLSGEEDMCVVFFPGITHLLLDARSHPIPKKNLKEEGMRILQEKGLDSMPASGAIWWEETDHGYAITPVVYAKGAGTLFAESACGSGTLALSLFLREKRGGEHFFVRQPSKDVLETVFGENGRIASVSGDVCLRAEGTIFLE